MMSLLFAACSSAGLFLINTAARLGAGFEKTPDISFGSEPWQRLDVYTPVSGMADRADEDLPVLVFFYGGGWDSGSKSDYLFVAEAFTALGYVVVLPDYVKYPTARFPVFIEDGASALAWVKRNIGTYRGDPERVFVAGHSAGAHLGALLLTDERYLLDEGYTPADVRAFGGLAGPYNFVPQEAQYRRIFDPPENYPRIQASNFVDGDEPPMFLARGSEDDTVGPENQRRLSASLSAQRIDHEARTYESVSHVGIVLGIAPLLRRNSSVIEDMHEFFRRYQ